MFLKYGILYNKTCGSNYTKGKVLAPTFHVPTVDESHFPHSLYLYFCSKLTLLVSESEFDYNAVNVEYVCFRRTCVGWAKCRCNDDRFKQVRLYNIYIYIKN